MINRTVRTLAGTCLSLCILLLAAGCDSAIEDVCSAAGIECGADLQNPENTPQADFGIEQFQSLKNVAIR